ncbi:FKBP-type peptidyl-prolyl cis-trans isomerase [Allohahella sp. A8]|uniref:FKBP-type peptidyl-prolyl cis-trans isomerase n=1 Tax=Allohahella sp. A8 TaxID=3141461 RepID=UPI000C0B755A|nr:peptidylprolyl isomerase [Hahellaceae bacterium]|tara:strand:- start:28995 stop:29843 length:849 start_codon:yes stop_codon:yes gene_type:complete
MTTPSFKALLAGSCIALVSLTACSGENDSADKASTTATAPAETTSTAPADTETAGGGELATDIDKISYSFGQMLGRRMNMQMQDLNMDKFMVGVQDAYSEKPSKISDEEMNQLMQQYQIEQQEKQQKEFTELADKNLEKGKKFLEENKSKEGVKVTDSGLQYKVIEEGEGDSPTAEDTVEVHYTGKLIDGEVFDSSVERGEPAVFPLAGVIPGWVEGLQLMKKGAKYQLFIPADLAYGPQGNGRIGPNETLIFDVELLNIEETPAAAQQPEMAPELSEEDAG